MAKKKKRPDKENKTGLAKAVSGVATFQIGLKQKDQQDPSLPKVNNDQTHQNEG